MTSIALNRPLKTLHIEPKESIGPFSQYRSEDVETMLTRRLREIRRARLLRAFIYGAAINLTTGALAGFFLTKVLP